jgi:hypothetical protein
VGQFTLAANVESIYEELLKFARQLNEEEQRHVREQLTEEELAIFDLLMKPRPDITAKEEKQVKKVAKGMLQTLKTQALCWIGASGSSHGRRCGFASRNGWISCRRRSQPRSTGSSVRRCTSMCMTVMEWLEKGWHNADTTLAVFLDPL